LLSLSVLFGVSFGGKERKRGTLPRVTTIREEKRGRSTSSWSLQGRIWEEKKKVLMVFEHKGPKKGRKRAGSILNATTPLSPSG